MGGSTFRHGAAGHAPLFVSNYLARRNAVCLAPPLKQSDSNRSAQLESNPSAVIHWIAQFLATAQA